MNERDATLDRLETQIDDQRVRNDAPKRSAMHALPHGPKGDRPPLTRWARGFHIGAATGV